MPCSAIQSVTRLTNGRSTFGVLHTSAMRVTHRCDTQNGLAKKTRRLEASGFLVLVKGADHLKRNLVIHALFCS
jgi:hypothetical protein